MLNKLILKSAIILGALFLFSCDGGSGGSGSSDSSNNGGSSSGSDLPSGSISDFFSEAPSSAANTKLALEATAASDPDDNVNLLLDIGPSAIAINGDNSNAITDYNYTVIDTTQAMFDLSIRDGQVDLDAELTINFSTDRFSLTYSGTSSGTVSGNFIMAGSDINISINVAPNNVFFGQNPGITPPLSFENLMVEANVTEATFPDDLGKVTFSYDANTFTVRNFSGTYTYAITDYDKAIVQYSYPSEGTSGTIELIYTSSDSGIFKDTYTGDVSGTNFGTFKFR